MLNVSYPDELETSNINENSDEKNNNFINVSVESNVSIELINCQVDVGNAPANLKNMKPVIENITDSLKKIEQLNISYDSNDSLEIQNVGISAHKPGILALL